MSHPRLRKLEQADAYSSPWTVKHRLKSVAWNIVQATLFRWSPKPMLRWRNLLLRLFGARISGLPFVSPSAIIKYPWQLALEDRACLGPGSEVYNLGYCTLKARCTIAQQVYLCGGTHDLADPGLPLVVGDIEVGEDAFIGAQAFLMPGVSVGRMAVVGARAVVVKDVAEGKIVAGNPAREIGVRNWRGKTENSETSEVSEHSET
jgi:putative colanic acid biosynthesis acetyltransferase WcaF